MPAHAGERGDVGQWLDGADLVVGVHDRHEHGVWLQRTPQVGRVDAAVATDG
jgi:hypothetical protein